MAQVSWVYLDNNDGRHRVGLYHGDTSGHLMIYINLRVVQIDFSVKESKVYTFFIENELVEVRLHKEKTGFSYEFFVNKTADTPLNRARKQVNRRNGWKIGLFFGVALTLVFALFFGIRSYNRALQEKRWAASGINSQLSPEAEQHLRLEGKTAVARIFFMQNGARRQVAYHFETEKSEAINGKINVPDTGKIVLPTGFWLSDRDEFQVSYLPSDPKTHRIRYDQPTELQINLYLRAAVAAELAAHPGKSTQAAGCLATIVKREKGWQALADVLNQGTPPWQNADHNSDSYQRLVRDVALEKKLKENCWDK